jgi:hypothetical protein
MAYYSGGKHTFASVIDRVKEQISKDFLRYKLSCWYSEYEEDSSKCFVETMLYNESYDEIRKELNGFVAGRLFGTIPFDDYDELLISRDLMPVLAKIKKEMVVENNWEEESLDGWEYCLD